MLPLLAGRSNHIPHLSGPYLRLANSRVEIVDLVEVMPLDSDLVYDREFFTRRSAEVRVDFGADAFVLVDTQCQWVDPVGIFHRVLELYYVDWNTHEKGRKRTS